MVYALSLDFDLDRLFDILVWAPEEVARDLSAALGQKLQAPRSVELAEPVRVGVRARLGPPKRGLQDTFVPLICHEVLPPSEPTLSGLADPLTVVITRQEVEAADVTSTLDVLNGWIRGSNRPVELSGQLMLAIDGYDDDARELWQIPEVRCYIYELDQRFPYWFFFANPHSDTLKVVAFCLTRTTSVRPGLTQIDPSSMGAFLARHFEALNVLCEKWNLPDSRNQELCEAVLQSLS